MKTATTMKTTTLDQREGGRHEDGPKKVVKQCVGQPPCMLWPKTCAIPAKLAHNGGGFPNGGAQGALDRIGTPNTYIPAAPGRYSEDLFTVNSFRINKGIHPNTKLVTKMTAVDKVLQRSICVTTSSTNKIGAQHIF